MTTLPLRHRVLFGAFWLAVLVAMFVAMLGLTHVLVGTGEVTSFRLVAHVAYDDGRDDDGNSGGEQGSGNDQRHCHESQNCRGSFSPGPFDRSPVDVHDNCVSLDCSGRDPSKKPPPSQGKASLTDPTKLPTVVAGIIKSGLDLGRMFADGTITFVENMLLALA